MDPLGGFRLGGILLECLGEPWAGRSLCWVTRRAVRQGLAEVVETLQADRAIVIVVMANDAAPIIRLRVMLTYPLRSAGGRCVVTRSKPRATEEEHDGIGENDGTDDGDAVLERADTNGHGGSYSCMFGCRTIRRCRCQMNCRERASFL